MIRVFDIARQAVRLGRRLGSAAAFAALASGPAASAGPEAAPQAGPQSGSQGGAGAPMQDLSRTSPGDLGLKVDEKLGAILPMELEFTNAEGERKRLGDFFSRTGPGGEKIAGKPAIIALVYYRCPVICTTLLNTICDCVRDIEGLDAGADYNVLTFSFDPQDDKYAAARRKEALVESYGRKDRPGDPAGWQFFLHEEGSTRQLANALGFQYRKNEANGEFAHPVVFFLATPEGKISRYLYGFGHSALQLRLAILDAGQGTITQSLKDQFLTFCYMFDPKVGRYTLSAIRVMQAGGIVTLVGLAGLIGVLLIGERLRARRLRAAGAAAGARAGTESTRARPATLIR